MLTDSTAIRTYFAKLGLELEIADIYLALHAHGPQSISELARTSKVERTRIYRLIDRLLESNLIEVESRYKRGIIKAAPIANLNILIAQKEQELKSLQDELGLIEQVLARNSLSSPTTRVQFYQGPEGYKQTLWNRTKAKGEILLICHEIMQPKINTTFYNRWVEKTNQLGLKIREIHGDAFRKSHRQWYAKHDNMRHQHYQARYVANKVFPITHTAAIYNDVTTYDSWHGGEIFGLEIYNQQIADAQRAFFEMLWGKSIPETVVD